MINWRKNSSTSIQKERYPIQISKLTTNIAPSTSGKVARCGCKYGVIKGQNIATNKLVQNWDVLFFNIIVILFVIFCTHKNPPRPVDLVRMNASRFIIDALEMLESKVFRSKLWRFLMWAVENELDWTVAQQLLCISSIFYSLYCYIITYIIRK